MGSEWEPAPESVAVKGVILGYTPCRRALDPFHTEAPQAHSAWETLVFWLLPTAISFEYVLQ
jgi:hypothetical protein